MPCHPKCRTAKGRKCKCSCGGKMHGTMGQLSFAEFNEDPREPTFLDLLTQPAPRAITHTGTSIMKILSCFPSKYLKAADIGDRKITAIMEYVALEDIGEPDPKPILYFKNCAKGMVLNKTNAKAILAAYGDETDNWRGKSVILFAAMVDYRGDTVEALRVKIPAAAADQPKVLKKDTRDIYTALQAEMDDAASSVEKLRAWSSTAAPRIRQLPADWQLALSSCHIEKISDLLAGKEARPCAEMLSDAWADRQAGSLLRGMRETVTQAVLEDHDGDGVVWEETHERAATVADRLDHTDMNGVPAFLARQTLAKDILFPGQ